VGVAGWLVSFGLPSMRWFSLGHWVTELGYLVARDGAGQFFVWIAAPRENWSSWSAMPLLFGWTANFLIPLAGLSPRRWARIAVALGLALVWYPVATEMRESLWLGYFVWATGLTLQAVASWLLPKPGAAADPRLCATQPAP
jgi:hypothetical protein